MKLRSALRTGLGMILILFNSFAVAQHGTLNGIILMDTSAVLPSATISLGNKSVLTNTDGAFSISMLPGNYQLTITHVGYKKIERRVTITSGESLFLQLQMSKEDQMGEVVVLGSRSSIHRSNLNTPVPVDVVNAQELGQFNFTDPKLLLTGNIPSFNSPPQNIGPASYLEPATLRGLAPDQLLVLINGRRRHNMAMIYQQLSIGRGTSGTDINSIPRSAIEKIEVLRDGASAQYGSDAIAGVINIELKKSIGKASVSFQTGQRYEGDGDQLNLGLNKGFAFLRKGFLNISGDLRYRQSTDRTAGPYTGTVYTNNTRIDDSLILARGFDRKKAAKVGTPDLINTGMVITGGYPFDNKTKLFWTGTVNYRHVKEQFGGGAIYRFPKDTLRINKELFPNGFLSYGSPTLWDGSALVGIEGKTKDQWCWDFSSVAGMNAQRFEQHNTNNASQQASLGKNAPTNFYIGTVSFRQFTNNMNFAKDFAKVLEGVKSFNVGLGAEFRVENFEIDAGEEASWKNYNPASGKQGGSQVSVGFDTSNAVEATRSIVGFYGELDMEKNEHLLVNLASRYEHYSDYGSNLAGKLALRYKFSNKFSLRGAFSNGFRAPSIQQTYFSRTNQVNSKTFQIKTTGTFRNNSPVVRAFHIPPLGPEKSLNLSAGFTSQLSGNISLTVDAYWIQIKKRIVLTGAFDTTNPAVKVILADYPEIQAVSFFSNAINTETRGIDIIFNSNWKVGKGKLEVELAANFNRTQLFGKIQTSDKLPLDAKTTSTVMNPEVRGLIEWGQPHERIIFRVGYELRKWGFRCTNIFAGGTQHFNSGTDSLARTLDETFSSKMNTSCNIHYTPKSWLVLSLGVRNLFDVYPDPVKNIDNTLYGTWKYDSTAPQFGFDGGFYYMNILVQF